MFAGIETGGTKTVCALGHDGRVMRRTQFTTGDDPGLLVDRCAEFFAGQPVTALGLGTFGPCDTEPGSATYGHILATPKPGWSGVDLVGLLERRLALAIHMTTDVTAAALAEQRYGAGVGVRDLVYLTIGTGIGGGAIVDGRPLHGAGYPEMGHMLVPGSTAAGSCPFHGGCLEGLASGPAMQARAGRPAQLIADDDPAWEQQARIVAAGLHNIVCTLAPKRLIIGGGVGSRAGLHQHLPALLTGSLAGYLPAPTIVPPALGADAGVIGALTLAQDHSQG